MGSAGLRTKGPHPGGVQALASKVSLSTTMWDAMWYWESNLGCMYARHAPHYMKYFPTLLHVS